MPLRCSCFFTGYKAGPYPDARRTVSNAQVGTHIWFMRRYVLTIMQQPGHGHLRCPQQQPR